jgi:hypothetical protein
VRLGRVTRRCVCVCECGGGVLTGFTPHGDMLIPWSVQCTPV